MSTHGLDPAFDDAVREVTQRFCDGPICVECCVCRDCGRKVGTRHLDVCACLPDALHWRCPECAAKRVATALDEHNDGHESPADVEGHDDIA